MFRLEAVFFGLAELSSPQIPYRNYGSPPTHNVHEMNAALQIDRCASKFPPS